MENDKDKLCSAGLSVTKYTTYTGDHYRKELWDYEIEGKWYEVTRGLKEIIAFLDGDLRPADGYVGD